MLESSRLKQAVQKLQRQMPEAMDQGDGSGGGLMPPSVGSQFPVPTPIITTPPPSAANQARNGELSHSVDTWFNPPPGSPTLDIGKEAVFWFSHTAPVAGQVLDFTDSRTSAINNTLKAFGDFGGQHSTYLATRCDWDRAAGVARLQGSTSLDAPFPNNRCVTANRAVEYLGALIAFRNSTIVAQSDNHIYCGLWDKDKKDWISGTPFTISAVVRLNAGPIGTTERRYKVYAFTDRGFTYLSAETIVLTAPDDAGFASADVYLAWKAIPGILQYHVYRFDVVAGKYRLLKRIGSGAANYGDNNRMENDNAGGYPAATNTTLIAYTATREHGLDNVAVDGDPWTDLRLAPAVPSDYDASLTTGEQVLRIGLTKALDRMMVDAVSVTATNRIASATGEFTALDSGRTATLLDADGNILHGPEAITFIDATHVDFATNVGTSSSTAVLYIVEGGDHGLLIDAIHVSYVANSAFAAYPDDLNRRENGGQNPIAAPTHSSQGGSGGGGGSLDPGEGDIGCITFDCPVNVWVGDQLESWPWKAVRVGEYLFSGDLVANRVLAKPIAPYPASLHLLRVRASWFYDIEVPCSPRQPIITERLDGQGRAVEHLKPGDYALISINGNIKRTQIREIVNTGKEADVGVFTLVRGSVFFAGYPRYRFRMIAWVLRKFRWHKLIVGVGLHNRKSGGGELP